MQNTCYSMCHQCRQDAETPCKPTRYLDTPSTSDQARGRPGSCIHPTHPPVASDQILYLQKTLLTAERHGNRRKTSVRCLPESSTARMVPRRSRHESNQIRKVISVWRTWRRLAWGSDYFRWHADIAKRDFLSDPRKRPR
jgi:hypothetical protein